MNMRIVFIALILFISLPTFAWACRCIAPNDDIAANTYQEADIVIQAEIINPSKGFTQSGPLVSVNVIDIIKGDDVPEIINLNYNNETAACGNYYEAGQTVIIGIYDTRSLSTNQSARGHGYRVMSSCQQIYIQHHLDNQKTIELK